MMKTLTKEEILAVEDRPVRELNVPQWGGKLNIRTPTGAEYEAFAQMCRERAAANAAFDIRGLRVEVIRMCLVDDMGSTLFTAEDLEALAGKSNKTLEFIWLECRDVMGLSDEALEELEGE